MPLTQPQAQREAPRWTPPPLVQFASGLLLGWLLVFAMWNPKHRAPVDNYLNDVAKASVWWGYWERRG